MPKLQLTLACWNYDRTRALLEGRVTVDGVDLNYLNLPVEETFFRMLRHQEFRRRRDVAVLLHAIAVPRKSAVHCDPGLSFAHVPAFLHLRPRAQRDSRAQGFDRQARRQP